MVKLTIDGKIYYAEEKENLLKACLSLGIDIPYFCYHPVLGSVAACRQCAVKMFKDENDTKGKIVMSCMQPVKDNMILSVEDEEVKEFRAQIIECLMNNHPHDCPVCDEGGECHLQDMTIMTGHVYRTNRMPKRTYINQDLGPFINHEMNRCIQCYRCVRFYKEYAGGKDFDVLGIHDRVYFGRHEDGTLQNEFSGNLVEICPTGVFTDKSLKKHFTRKWDLTTAPSVCNHCSVGCNTIPGERYDTVRRIRNRYNSEINGYFLCDRGRYGYEYEHSEKRINKPLEKVGDSHSYIEKQKLILKLQEIFSKGKLIGVGSPRASLESNYALKKLVGDASFYSGMGLHKDNNMKNIIDIFQSHLFKVPSVIETEQSDFVLILGEDITQTSPRLALSVRQTLMSKAKRAAQKAGVLEWQDHAVRDFYQNQKAPLFQVCPVETKLNDVAEKTLFLPVDETALFVSALAKQIDEEAPDPSRSIENWQYELTQIAERFAKAKNPLIITGTSNGDNELLKATANLIRALNQKDITPGVNFVLGEANDMGLALMGSNTFSDLLKNKKDVKDAHLIVLENDLFRRYPETLVDETLRRFETITTLDYLENDTTRLSDFLLPAGTVFDSTGTFVNYETRGQRFYKVRQSGGDVMESWRWLNALRHKTNTKWTKVDECLGSLISDDAGFDPLKDFIKRDNAWLPNHKIPRQTHRYSGRTAMEAHHDVHESKSTEDQDSPLNFSMEGSKKDIPSSLRSYYWHPGWNSVQALNKFQSETGGDMLHEDTGILLMHPETNIPGTYYSLDTIKKSDEDDLKLQVQSRIFGSEVLSNYSARVQEQIDEPFVLLHENEALKRGLKENDPVIIETGGKEYVFKLKVSDAMAEQLAVINPGSKSFIVPEIPCYSRVRKTKRA